MHLLIIKHLTFFTTTTTTTDINKIKIDNYYLLMNLFLSSSSFVSPVFLSSEWYLQRRSLWTSSLAWQRWSVLSSANPWPCYWTASPVSPDSPCVHASPWKSNTIITETSSDQLCRFIFLDQMTFRGWVTTLKTNLTVQIVIYTLILWRLWQTICVYDTAARQKQL